MSIISIPNTFSAGAVIVASQHNSNFSTIVGDYNGYIDNTNISASAAIAYSKLNLALGIVNADISASAAIVDTKLAQITTASKVSGTSITGLASLPAGAGVVPTANLGSGSASSSTFLRGDQSYAQATGIPSNIQVFTSSGTWTKPDGISQVYVKVWGAGGQGGANTVGGAGGGGGGYSEGTTAVSGNVTVTVGVGGTTGSGVPSTGQSGTASSFAGTVTLTGNGGSGGTSTAGGAGGTATGGTINITGTTGGNGSGTNSVGNVIAGGSFGSGIGQSGSGGAGGLNTTGSVGKDGMVIVYY